MSGSKWSPQEKEHLISLINNNAILNDEKSSKSAVEDAWVQVYRGHMRYGRTPRGIKYQVSELMKTNRISNDIQPITAAALRKMESIPLPGANENDPSNDRNTESSTTDELALVVPASDTPNNTNTDVAMAELNNTVLKLAHEVENMRVKMNKLETKQEKMDNFLSSYGNTGPTADDQPTTPDSEAGQTDEDDDQRNTERNNGQTAPDSSLATTTENYQLITYGSDAGQPAANDSETYDGADDVTCAEFSRKTQLELKYESKERTRYTKRK